MLSVRQGIQHQLLVEHTPADPFGREAAPVPNLWEAIHCQLESVLSSDDTHQGEFPNSRVIMSEPFRRVMYRRQQQQQAITLGKVVITAAAAFSS